MSMKTVSVALLKQNLSKYLHMVAEGHELIVTSHQRPVARVISETTALIIRPPVRPASSISKIGGISVRASSLAVDMLLADRRSR